MSRDPEFRQRKDSLTRYGNTVTLLGAERETRRSLVWGPKEEQEIGAWETWVFSWSVRNIVAIPTDLLAAIAIIQLGAGGSVVEAIINLNRAGSIQLPSIVSKIDIGWDFREIPAAITLPASIVVDGIVRKGSTRGTAKRSIFRQAAAAGAVPAPVNIPAFARDMQVYGGSIVYHPANTYRFLQSSIYDFTGPEANANRATGRRFAIPALSSQVGSVTVPPAGLGTWLGQFDFTIEI